MDSLGGCVRKYKDQVRRGEIVTAYRGIMKFMSDLKTRMGKNHPECDLSSSIYMGHMDMTYFSFTPHALSGKKLKFAVVFIHDSCRFEVWFAAGNKSVQRRYKLELAHKDLGEFKLADDPSDAVIEHVLTDAPDFDRPQALMRLIEDGTMAFIEKITALLDG
jgi:hypothetical protein